MTKIKINQGNGFMRATSKTWRPPVPWVFVGLFCLASVAFLGAADAGKTLLYYDDLGDETKSPHLIQGLHLSKWINSDAPEYSVAYHTNKVILLYTNLEPQLTYELKVTCVATSKRVQSLYANGTPVYEKYVCPTSPESKNYFLPAGIISNNSLTLEFVKDEGVNVVVSEVSLFSVGAVPPVTIPEVVGVVTNP